MPPCSLSNPYILSCFIPAPYACPPSCPPAVPNWSCVPRSVLAIGPFSLVKSSLGPKVTHILSTLMSSLKLVLLQSWVAAQSGMVGRDVGRDCALPCLHCEGLSGMPIHPLEKADKALER